MQWQHACNMHVHVHVVVMLCVHNMATNLLQLAMGQIQNFLDVSYCVSLSLCLPTTQLYKIPNPQKTAVPTSP